VTGQIQLAVGYTKPVLSGDDVALLPCAGPRRGNVDVQGIGGAARLLGGDMGTARAQFFGPSRLSVAQDLRIDKKGKAEDGINFGGKHAVAMVQRCRIVGVTGAQDKLHGDCVQVYNAKKPEDQVDALLIEDCTFGTAYQAVMTTDNVGLIILRRVNIFNEVALRQQPNSVAILRMAKATARPCTIILDDVWIADWPAGYEIATTGSTTVIGQINVGTPPNGDFCPAV
jgi:hypothetical protein